MINQQNLLPNSSNRIKSILPVELHNSFVLRLLSLAILEDLSNDVKHHKLKTVPVDMDITSRATLLADSLLTGYIRAKAGGVVAGLPIAEAVFSMVDANMSFTAMVQDGARVEPGLLLAEVSGSGRSILTGERTALNFLSRMSGIASLTRQFVDAVSGTHAVILDTRKTAPGLRHLDKYSVRMGGGQNHRTGLFDMILIKDNHISGAGGITSAVERVRAMYGDKYSIEVEVKNLNELEETLSLKVDRIMLDNMDLETMRNAVQVSSGRIPLEASGNVSLATVRQIAETGVDFISSGALTHSAPTLDISMKIG